MPPSDDLCWIELSAFKFEPTRFFCIYADSGHMTKQLHTHETHKRTDQVKRGSDRAFGIVFAVVFALIGFWPLVSGATPRIWALAIGGVFLAVALIYPRVLGPLNLVWFRFGMLLHRVVSPVILGLMFFVSVTPIALIMRALGKDPLRLKFDPEADSYWLTREPPGPPPDSLKNQF